ncbi:MAG: ATP-binding protein [Candidatus Acidiferrales bacterium]
MKALPIRIRLTAWYSLILALSIGVSGSISYFAMSHSINAAIDAGLRQRLGGIRTLIAQTAPQGRAALVDELAEFDEGQGGRGLVSVADEDGAIYSSAGIAELSARDRRANAAKPFYAKLHSEEFRVMEEPVQVGAKTYQIEVATYTEDFDRASDRFQKVLYSIAPAFLILAALGGYWMSRRALAPVDEIIVAARRVGVKDLSERLSVSQTGDELERLTTTLNGMLDRLEASFQRITQFTADASHELRTPISVMRTNAEITLRKSRSESEYREAITQILEELEDLSALVEQLLDLARADSATGSLIPVRTNLNEVLEKAYRQTQVLCEQKQLKTKAQTSEQPVWVQGDPAALERLFLIVLENAVKYTLPGGHVDVELKAHDGLAITEIRDDGIGMAPQDIAHIFERFYQVDPARSRENGGRGLGLAIGRWIAQTHGGDIIVESEVAKGSCFMIRLPLAF